MDGSVLFSPATAPQGTTISYVATITNPADHRLLVPLPFSEDGFSIYLWTPEPTA